MTKTKTNPPLRRHPGHVLLRAFVPNDHDRRFLMSRLCRGDEWQPELVIAAAAKRRDSRPLTSADLHWIRCFVESI